MAAVAIEISDDEASTVPLGAASTASKQSILSFGEYVQSSDESLAWLLQQEQDVTLDSCSDAHRNVFATATSACASDAELALQLQYEEENAGHADCTLQIPPAKRQRATVDEVCIVGDTAKIIAGAETKAAMPVIPESPLCPDAVALLHDGFGRAGDARRSEIFLCGSTPFFFQSKGGLRSRQSTVAVPSQSLQAVPRDIWSCGYRNVQMLVGHLLARPSGQGSWPQLFGGAVPNVSCLQAELDRLWACGYDPEGRQQLGGSVSGTQRWIGTSEACVLLRGQSVRCNVVSFRSGSDTDGLTAATAVMERCMRHFAGGCKMSCAQRGVTLSPQPPLYLQHDGHSRTVVGVQRRHELNGSCSDFLLVLDPGLGQKGFEDFSSAAQRGSGWERFVKRSIAPLKRKAEYELLITDPYTAIAPDQQVAARRITYRI